MSCSLLQCFNAVQCVNAYCSVVQHNNGAHKSTLLKLLVSEERERKSNVMQRVAV